MSLRLKVWIYLGVMIALYATGVAAFGWKEGSLCFVGAVGGACLVQLAFRS